MRLHRRHHDVQLIRPRQQRRQSDAAARSGRGADARAADAALPNLRMGVPSKRALVQLWVQAPARRGAHRHRGAAGLVGAAGRAAPAAARDLGLPHQLPRLRPPLRHGPGCRPSPAYLRKFRQPLRRHHGAHRGHIRRLLAGQGFERLHVVGRVDYATLRPARRSDLLRGEGAGPDDLVCGCVGHGPEKPGGRGGRLPRPLQRQRPACPPGVGGRWAHARASCWPACPRRCSSARSQRR